MRYNDLPPPGYFLRPENFPTWLPSVMPHWLPTSLVRTPPELPPAAWPEPKVPLGYGLLDDLAKLQPTASPWPELSGLSANMLGSTLASKPGYGLLDNLANVPRKPMSWADTVMQPGYGLLDDLAKIPPEPASSPELPQSSWLLGALLSVPSQPPWPEDAEATPPTAFDTSMGGSGPLFLQSGTMGTPPAVEPPFPAPPESWADAAYRTSLDRWRRIGGAAHKFLFGDPNATVRVPINEYTGMPATLQDYEEIYGHLPWYEQPTHPAIEENTNLASVAVGLGAPFAMRNALGMAGGKLAATKLPMDEASRVARAKGLGFRTNMPIAFGVAPEGEKISTSAVKVNNRLFTGVTHGHAMEEAERALGKPFDKLKKAPIWHGFITDSGRFISRPEANYIAEHARQGHSKGRFATEFGLSSEETNMVAPNMVRSSYKSVGATEPGLTGEQGVWGRLLPKGTTDTSALWHRSSSTKSLNVRGIPDEEIQKLLRAAWDEGHDAVIMKNYIRSGGNHPETVVVVRRGNQLRSPGAIFDPAKVKRTDLLAGFAGIGLLPLFLSDEEEPASPQ